MTLAQSHIVFCRTVYPRAYEKDHLTDHILSSPTNDDIFIYYDLKGIIWWNFTQDIPILIWSKVSPVEDSTVFSALHFPAGRVFWNPLSSAVNWAGKATLCMFSHSHSCQGQRVWCLLFGRKSSESTALCSCQPSGQLVTGSGNPSRSFPSECRMW